MSKQEIDTKKLSETQEMEYFLPSLPMWTLRTSGSSGDLSDSDKEISMYRNCFDGEGSQLLRNHYKYKMF